MRRANILGFLIGLALVTCLTGCDGVDGPIISSEPIWQYPLDAPDFDGSALWGLSPDDIWIVGPRDTMMHYDGAAWSSVEVSTGALNSIWTIWGASSNDIWAGGDIPGGLLHWDGEAWSTVSTPNPWTPNPSYDQLTILDIWGASTSDVWAVGDLGKVLHWNGSEWVAYDIDPDHPSLFAIWGFASDDVWGVGEGAEVWHWDGSAWSNVVNGTSSTQRLTDVWGSSASDIWAVGGSGLMLHWDGSAWSEVTGFTDYFEAVWGFSSDDVWVGARGAENQPYHWDGTEWTNDTAISSPMNIDSIWGAAPDDIWAIGNDIMHYDYYQLGN